MESRIKNNKKLDMICRCSLGKFYVPSDSDILQKKEAKEGWKAWTDASNQTS